ncbi:MAG TPA: ribonuclease P protein component [Solirubrobacteraceae bacterium]
MAGARSPRRGRLSRSADFDRVLRNGRSHAGRELVLYVFPRGGDESPRLGLSVSRKVGGAVERNTVKRLLREAFAGQRERLPAGTDVVVIARPGAGELAQRQGLHGIQSALRELVDRVAVVEARPGASQVDSADREAADREAADREAVEAE